jgi:archaetidylinositol phosphate synthase
MTQEVARHVREHKSILAGAEKRALLYLAGKLPRQVNSDHLTILGFAGILCAAAFFWLGGYDRRLLLGVPPALVVNWFGDSLDGTVARVRNCQRPRYGYYVDHVLDVVGIVFLLMGLSLSGFMSPVVAMGLLAAYLMVAAEVFLATSVHGVFRLSSMGFGPTELRIILSAGALFLLRSPVSRIPWMGSYLLFDVGGCVAIVGLSLAFILSAGKNIRDLYRAEPIPR